MFSVQQKRHIANEVQRILRETNHPELPAGEIPFALHVEGAESWSWADIKNNGAISDPRINPWNESQDLARAAVRELVDALQAILAAVPVAPHCETFHHAKRDQHLFGKCPPLARYLAALEGARAAIAKHQEGEG